MFPNQLTNHVITKLHLSLILKYSVKMRSTNWVAWCRGTSLRRDCTSACLWCTHFRLLSTSTSTTCGIIGGTSRHVQLRIINFFKTSYQCETFIGLTHDKVSKTVGLEEQNRLLLLLGCFRVEYISELLYRIATTRTGAGVGFTTFLITITNTRFRGWVNLIIKSILYIKLKLFASAISWEARKKTDISRIFSIIILEEFLITLGTFARSRDWDLAILATGWLFRTWSWAFWSWTIRSWSRWFRCFRLFATSNTHSTNVSFNFSRWG